MNSDPHESAAWRAFGMLDTDETAGFDEASRGDPALLQAYQEINRLSAAIAVATVTPVKPQPGQLNRLHTRLGLNKPKPQNWKMISGWAAAAVIALLAILDRTFLIEKQMASNSRKKENAFSTAEFAAKPALQAEENSLSPIASLAEESPMTSALPLEDSTALPAGDVISTAKVDKRRLIQQIEVLREQLVDLQKRDQQRFEVVPGMSMSILIKMRPPGSTDNAESALLDSAMPMTAMMADALASVNKLTSRENADKTVGLKTGLFDESTSENFASAYPIYDPARDTGTIVVDNLPPKNSNESYKLWVTPQEGAEPVLVGELPDSIIDGENRFDFSLGSTGVVPAAFYMTKDLKGESRPPSIQNTILQGPN